MDKQGRKAYAALLTNEAYLPGLLLLDHTLKQVSTRYPLVVLTTASFPEKHLALLTALGIEYRKVDLLEPKGEVKLIEERFRDTWSKLQAFALEDYERIVLLDCDMTVFENIDHLLDDDDILPGPDWIAASHVCACNPLDEDWYLPDCKPENCAFTYAESQSTAAPPPASMLSQKRTYGLLNSGLVVLRPSRALHDRIVSHLHTSPTVATMALPDQDLLGEVFAGRWTPLPWRMNALKTFRWVHPDLWFTEGANGRKVEGRDRNEMQGEGHGISVLHYIVEKPWLEALPADSRDAETHRWWWADWDKMLEAWRRDAKLQSYVDSVQALVVAGQQV
ncbi:hypothetical protein B0A53_03478 [Rhodotorula sp. CCFEE 5036]|nr:hypothetical protein B0A53_03478 [Rhodotorula sp. CCFEE 5036]